MRHPTKDDCFKKLRDINAPIGTLLVVGVKMPTKDVILDHGLEVYRDGFDISK